ncbi:MAG: 6-phosphogluconolactonase [Phycisphaerales bacterium]
MARMPAAKPDDEDDFAKLHERGKLHRVERPDGAEAYAVDTPFVPRPPLPGEVHAVLGADQAIDAATADLVVQAGGCVRAFGDFHIALSGDPALAPLYERLMYDPNCRGLPWVKTHLWIVDERCVPFDDAESSFRLVRETIVDHSDIPPEQVHPIFAMGDDPAAAYEATLRETLAWREKGQDRLDFVMLALAPDGSTAGLLPGSPLLRDRHLVGRDARGRGTGASATDRISMTPTLINAARCIAVYACGAGCADAVRRLVAGREPLDELPVKAIHPVGGALRWYLDAEAVGG